LICTPHYSHTTIGIEAFKAGLHVLMEKPISVHMADCEKLLAAYKNKKTLFAAMFNQRTDPHYQKIRQMVQGGELGRVQRIQWTVTDWFRSQAYYDSGGWRATWEGEGGGVLLNQCVHNIDLFQWIFGMPKKVHAICRIAHYHDIEVEDEVTAIFEFPDKTTAVLVTSTGEAPGVNRLEVAGDLGRLTLENGELTFVRNEIETSHHSRVTKEGYEPPPCKTEKIPLPNRGDQHTGILKNFTNAILHGEKLLSPGVEGARSVELINAMLYSSFQEVTVTLPLSAAKYEKLLKRLISESTYRKNISPYEGGQGNYLLNT
jgi:predicted dehydrogenase